MIKMPMGACGLPTTKIDQYLLLQSISIRCVMR